MAETERKRRVVRCAGCRKQWQTEEPSNGAPAYCVICRQRKVNGVPLPRSSAARNGEVTLTRRAGTRYDNGIAQAEQRQRRSTVFPVNQENWKDLLKHTELVRAAEAAIAYLEQGRAEEALTALVQARRRVRD